MPYIGKEPVAGNFVLLDSITTSATATYALTKDSVAYSPESARNMIVSLNGVTQAPETAFTVSGSNITFSSALTSSDVIDYILVLGDVLSVGTPSDGTVGTSQMSYPLGNFSSTGIDDNATSTAITIDSSQNVGIGTTTPVSLGAGYKNLDIRHTTGGGVTLGDTSNIHGYLFSDNDGLTLQAPGSRTLEFMTGSTERMRIDSDGNLLVGTVNALTSAELSAGETGIALRSGNLLIVSREAGAGVLINRKTSDGDFIEFRRDGTSKGTIGVYGNDIGFAANGGLVRIKGHSVYREGANGSGLHFTTNAVIPANENGSVSTDTEDLGLGAYRWKDLYLSGGAYIGGTGSGNYLDDYEEGNWTPTASSGFSSLTPDTSNCRYTKIGNTVHVRGEIGGISGQNAATFVVGGLPFSVATGVESSFSVMYTQLNIDTNYSQLVGYAQAGSNVFRIYECGDSQTWSAVIGTQTSSSTSLIFALTYETS